jgi:hypothetical protein
MTFGNVIGQCASCGGALLNGHLCNPKKPDLTTVKCEEDPGDELRCITHDCAAHMQCGKAGCPHCAEADLRTDAEKIASAKASIEQARIRFRNSSERKS